MLVGIFLRDSAHNFGVEFESSRHREILNMQNQLARGQKAIGSHLNKL